MDNHVPHLTGTDLSPHVWPPPPSCCAVPPPTKLPLTNAQLYWGMVGRMTLMGLARGAGLGAAFGIFFWIIGSLVGLPIGGAAGLLLGFLDGLVLGALTLGRFRRMGDPETFRMTLCLVSGLVTLLSLTPLVWLLARETFGSGDDLWLIAAIPALVATVAASEAGWRAAKWYLDVF